MTITAPHRTRNASALSARLTAIAGWSLILVAALHTAVFIPQAPWSEWIDGGLQRSDPDLESVVVFWALPGGFVVPGLIAGLLMIKAGRRRERVGLGVALTLGVWISACLWLVGPSGFMFMYATVGLLIAAAVADRRAVKDTV